jgi:hypothetical protein
MSINIFAAGFRQRLLRGLVASLPAALMFVTLGLVGEAKASFSVGTTTLTSSPNPSAQGQLVTFIATIAAQNGPLGCCNDAGSHVVFKDGSTTLSDVSAPTPANGGTFTVTFSTSSLTVGSHNITAQYRYTPGLGASGGGLASVTQVVQAAAPPAPAPAPVDNLNLLQIQGTATVAAISGQVITGQVDAAIGDAFSGGTTPITPGPNGLFMSFAAEPQRDAATQDARDAVNALAYAGGVYKAPPAPARDWSAWADVRGSGFDQSNTISSHEEQINVTGGIGRKLAPNFLVGVFTGYENFDFTMPSIAGKLTGEGGTIGSYAAWRFTDHWRADGMFGWSDLSYKGTAGAASDSFSGSRWLGSGAFTGTYHWAGFQLEPSARIYTLWENDTAYTDTLGTAQAAHSFSASRVSVGDKVSYPWLAYPTVGVVPYVGLYTDYRFSTNNALPVGIPYVGIQDGWSERVTAGVTLKHVSGATLALGGELGGLGGGYDLWTANARLDWPF